MKRAGRNLDRTHWRKSEKAEENMNIDFVSAAITSV
jgi:hypothetical protein